MYEYTNLIIAENPNFQIKQLNELGAKGWELVLKTQYYFILKRLIK